MRLWVAHITLFLDLEESSCSTNADKNRGRLIKLRQSSCAIPVALHMQVSDNMPTQRKNKRVGHHSILEHRRAWTSNKNTQHNQSTPTTGPIDPVQQTSQGSDAIALHTPQAATLALRLPARISLHYYTVASLATVVGRIRFKGVK